MGFVAKSINEFATSVRVGSIRCLAVVKIYVHLLTIEPALDMIIPLQNGCETMTTSKFEEQRFGVNQKEKIKAMKTKVDVLTLTATPIPRTLYMALSGVREMSVITTPPPARRPIKTHLAALGLETAGSAIRQELDRGGQVFYVVPRVEGIEDVAGKLREMVPGARIAIAHGQMNAAQLESIMLGFSSGEADILVCTTIIESGLDIPRVNTILVEDAHKFGLAQLYQLRGRVGRAGIQARAWLFYPTDGDGRAMLTEDAQKRLRAIQEFTQLGSGYQLAMRDLEIRGAGDILGAQQSGQINVVGFDLYTEMLEEAIREIRGQEIPQVDDTQIDLKLTAFIPADYILDLEQKMSAYRAVASAASRWELQEIEAGWCDRARSYSQTGLATVASNGIEADCEEVGFCSHQTRRHPAPCFRNADGGTGLELAEGKVTPTLTLSFCLRTG
jgi:transcription-repair coupling factor (superfamily II helicase)